MHITLTETQKTAPNPSHPKPHLQKPLYLFRYFTREEERGGRKEERLGKESKFSQLLRPEENWGENQVSPNKQRAGWRWEAQQRLRFSRGGEHRPASGAGSRDALTELLAAVGYRSHVCGE